MPPLQFPTPTAPEALKEQYMSQINILEKEIKDYEDKM
jgi:hypothetical protein